MKKSFIAAFIAIAAFASCNKIETAAPSFDELDITFDIADPDPDTKAIKTSWEEGDEILILFENKTENGQQAKLRYVSGEWKVTQKPSNLGLSGNVSIRFLAIHFPGTISYDSTKDYENQLGYVGGNVRIAKKQTSGILTSRGVLPLGTINLDQKLSSEEIQIVVPGISAKNFYSLSVTNNGNITKSSSGEENRPDNFGCSYLTRRYPYFDGYVTITYGGGVGVIKGVANADGVAFTGYYNDPAARYDSEVMDTDPYKYVFTLFDGENYYHYTLPKNSKKTLAAGKAIKLPAFDGKGSQTNWKRGEFENGHSYVDLGIVIGGKRIMWAETNVGASTEDAAGTKFAWGERETKTEFTWNNYKYSDGSSSSIPKMTKYVTNSYYGTLDNKSELLGVDDAARASWGEYWRIPNEEEVSALLNDCTWTWDSNKVGWKVTGKNGNWIFIPDYSGYWTATLDSNNGRKARAFTNDGENTMYMFAGDRKNGYYIRPVISK